MVFFLCNFFTARKVEYMFKRIFMKLKTLELEPTKIRNLGGRKIGASLLSQRLPNLIKNKYFSISFLVTFFSGSSKEVTYGADLNQDGEIGLLPAGGRSDYGLGATEVYEISNFVILIFGY